MKDSVGNVLQDGDSVVVVKALNVKGSSSGIKAGTKVRTIRLVDGVDGHDIDCKIDGFGRCSSSRAWSRKPDFADAVHRPLHRLFHGRNSGAAA